MNEATSKHCGTVTLAGRPNVGKSTLLNALLGYKLSIVTPKPQTTRNRILAIHNTDDAQVVFLDTPGIHRGDAPLNQYMNQAAENALDEGDLTVWILDAADKRRRSGLTPGEKHLVRALEARGVPVIAAVNKVDLVRPKERLLPLLADVGALEFVVAVVPISALHKDGVDLLWSEIVTRLPQGPPLFPPDVISEQTDRFFVAEFVREVVMTLCHKEVPYHTAVVVDRFVEHHKSVEVFVTIHVETVGQKKIVVGKGGATVARIRETAQREATDLLGHPVWLKLHVEVTPDWSTNPAGLKKMGYE